MPKVNQVEDSSISDLIPNRKTLLLITCQEDSSSKIHIKHLVNSLSEISFVLTWPHGKKNHPGFSNSTNKSEYFF